ncbi:pdzk7-like protein [Dinothrombium tinctorium]|uniref:Pdzk7-like protein n=1 Tax=Dinothrombium tinctorium TaxID=1965070 RepID=A0A443RC55_9ACAR|nr:pdzk7-like protein [Dinothrombium tinctorium]
MIMASCLLSSANGIANKTKNASQAFLNGGSNHHQMLNYHTNRATHFEMNGETNGAANGGSGNCNDTNGYRSVNGNTDTANDTTRVIKLCRNGSTQLGFSIRGGFEHGTGVFVSDVHPGSEAEREGLRSGDQILRVNGFSIEHAIHEEVIALIKSASRVVLKVKSVGMIPVKESQATCVSWKCVDRETIPACPVHNRSWPAKIQPTIIVPCSDPPSSSSSRSSTSETELFQNFASSSCDFMEAKVFISLTGGQSLGCSVVKGPANYPGIYVQVVKKGGIAEESGLEVGDQIIGINGTSLEPGDIEFSEAISMIKSCQQMTLTVRKRSGLNLFKTHKQQKIKALVHANAIEELSSPSNHHLLNYNHSPLSSKQSTSSSGSSDNPRYFDPSEHDFSMSEVESSSNDQIIKIPRVNHCNWKPETIDIPAPTVDLCKMSSAECNPILSAQKIYEEVRKEEERLAEERKKLEAEQKRLQSELQKLELERKQLENLKQDECKSISSSSTVSGSQSVSSRSSTTGDSGSCSNSGSQISFLDEIKKLAEKRDSENSLITNTLNKTKNLENTTANKVNKHYVPDGDKRKRHELLMEEFRAAHSKMFGNQIKLKATQSSTLETTTSTSEAKITSTTVSTVTNGSQAAIPCPPPLPNEVEIKKQRIAQTKSAPPLPTFVNDNGEKVTILRTTSPSKKSPPPVPIKKSSARCAPIVTIGSYANQPRNRFLENNNENGGNKSVIAVGEYSTVNGFASQLSTTNSDSQSSVTTKSPISIKINLQMPKGEK